MERRVLTLVIGSVAALVFAAGVGATTTPTSASCATPPANIVSWWPGEGAASDIIDGNSGSLQNGATFAPGIVGQAFSLDGVDAFVQVPDAPNLDFGPTSPITVALWAKMTGTASIMHLIGKRVGCGANGNEYQMAFDPTNGLSFGSDQGGVSTGLQLPLNTWTHLAATFDGTTFSFYINGTLVNTRTGMLGPVNAAPLEIGTSGTCGTFAGLIDEVQIFNRALSATEIQAVFGTPSSGKCTITVSASTLAKIAAGAATQYVVKNSNQWPAYESMMALSVLSEAEKAATNSGAPLSKDDADTILQEAKNLLDDQTTQAQTLLDKGAARVISFATDKLFSLPSQIGGSLGTLVAKGLDKLGKDKVAELETKLNTDLNTAADQQISVLTMKANQWAAQHVGDLLDLVQNNPKLAAAVDPVLMTLVSCTTSCSFSNLVANFPDILSNILPAGSLNGDGSASFNPADLASTAQTILSNVVGVQEGSGTPASGTYADLGDLKTLSDYQLDSYFPVDPLTDPSPVPPGWQPSQDPTQRQQVLDSALSSVTALSTLVGLADPKLAQGIQVVGSATIQVAETVSKVLQTTQDLSSFGIDVLGSVALTGNPVGAAVGIISSIFGGGGLFGGGGGSSSDQQQVLDAINQLSQQITHLQADMDNRFNRVDAELNNILTTLDFHFGQLNQTLAVVLQNLKTIQQDLAHIQGTLLDEQDQLNRLEAYVLAGNQASQYANFVGGQGNPDNLNTCFTYKSAGVDIGPSHYLDCATNMLSWSDVEAPSETWAPTNFSDYTDSNILPTLLGELPTLQSDGTSSPLECAPQYAASGSSCLYPASVNYLSQFAARNLGLLPLFTSAISCHNNLTLANPDQWRLGARAFLEFANEWPQYSSTAGNYNGLLDRVICRGQDLQVAIRNANGIQNTPNGTPINTLFDALFRKYWTKLADLGSAIDPADYEAKNVHGLDLWGGAYQSPHEMPAVAQTPMNAGNLKIGFVDAYDAAVGPLVPPDGLISLLAQVGSEPALIADQVGLDQLRFQYSVGRLVSLSCPGGQVGYFVDIEGVLEKSGDFVFETEGYFCGPNSLDPQGFQQYWNNNMNGVRSNFINNRLFTIGAWIRNNDGSWRGDCCPPTIIPRWATAVTQTLLADQTAFYSELNGDSTVAGKEQELTGAKRLIQAFANLGLSRSIQSNDYLRALLYGDESVSIIDGDRVKSDISGFYADPTRNLVDEEIAKLSPQGAPSNLTYALRQVFVRAQNQSSESSEQIDDTVADLQAFEDRMNAGALSGCDYQLSPASVVVDDAGGSGTISVVAVLYDLKNGCPWRATTGASWLSVSSNSSGDGNGSVTYSVAPNPTNSPRDGVFIIGGQILHVSQGAGPFIPTPTPTNTPPPTTSNTPTKMPTSTATLTTTLTPTNTRSAPPTATPTATQTSKATASPTRTPTGTHSVSGHVRYYGSGSPMAAVGVQLSGATPQVTSTDASGAFAFAGLGASDWTLTPQDLSGVGTAISALDAVFVLQAAVGLRQLNAQQTVACDTTGNGSVTALDAVYILQYAVGLIQTFPATQPCGSLWAFVPTPASTVTNEQMISPAIVQGTCQHGAMVFPHLTNNANNQDFAAVVVGDCNGNWKLATGTPVLAELRSAAQVRFARPSRGRGGRVRFPLVVESGEPFQALDSRISYDPARLQLVAVRRMNTAGNTLVQYNASVPGEVRIALASADPIVSTGGPVLALEFEPRRSGRLPPPRVLGATVTGRSAAAIGGE